jgi:8-oxo-dGTP pyrophosphatase MutT (NUDIX family)
MTDLADRLRRSLSDNPEPSEPYVGFQGLLDKFPVMTPAAVLVPIIDAPRPRVLLTVRHEGLRAHAGQVAFPGGRIDPGDDGPVGGALREAWEEVGLQPERVDVVGTTRGYATGSGYMITPVIGVIPDGLPFSRQEMEVSAVFEVPLDHLVDEAHHIAKSAMYEGYERHYYEIPWPEHYIWGVTAGLIVNLAPRLRGVLGSRA